MEMCSQTFWLRVRVLLLHVVLHVLAVKIMLGGDMKYTAIVRTYSGEGFAL